MFVFKHFPMFSSKREKGANSFKYGSKLKQSQAITCCHYSTYLFNERPSRHCTSLSISASLQLGVIFTMFTPTERQYAIPTQLLIVVLRQKIQKSAIQCLHQANVQCLVLVGVLELVSSASVCIRTSVCISASVCIRAHLRRSLYTGLNVPRR